MSLKEGFPLRFLLRVEGSRVPFKVPVQGFGYSGFLGLRL